ncbi:hypothetical protein SEN1985_31660 [Salmonella enterica subsp. enterica serovar Kentucky]|nr:hypothetical protein SEN1985_31660 [Salmonella enterica subsp. enterica serovar Kentucky]
MPRIIKTMPIKIYFIFVFDPSKFNFVIVGNQYKVFIVGITTPEDETITTF